MHNTNVGMVVVDLYRARHRRLYRSRDQYLVSAAGVLGGPALVSCRDDDYYAHVRL